ncbi:GNAT family N-acetyltransferase [Kribbella sp. NPDC051952]|uniref:GNAT family N-acetyltransferase n=1 Tax=Kribbella sp. NPDC051952 TaxID=3154851 RepID=UPI00343B6219
MSGLHPAYPLRTERLELRPHRREDLDDLYAFHSRPEVVRYTPWPVRNREETRAALEKKLVQGELTEPGQWLVLAIELRETGTVIGEVLLKWASEADRQGEIGFALHTDYQGKGLAAEAAREVLRLGFEDLELHRIVAILDDRNAPSAQLLERLGMRREGHHIHAMHFKGEWANEFVYALLKDEWISGRQESAESDRGQRRPAT